MSNKINDMEAYILAGGKSSRMGSDKGLLLMDNKAIIERIIEQLQPLFEKICIVSNNPEYKKFDLEVIEDLVKNMGPAGGIYTALNHAKTQNIFVVSCDMPFITRDAVQLIVNHSANQQITLFYNQDITEPLFALYSRDCLKKWKELIDRKMIKLQVMVTHFRLLKINADDYSFFDKNIFMNVNNKTDFEKALQYLQNEN